MTDSAASKHTREVIIGVKAFATYRWSLGMVGWAFQRITGLALAVYLVVHIIEVHALTKGPDFFDAHMRTFQHPAFKLAEISLLGAVILHALNGMRIIVMDTGVVSRRQKAALWVAAGVGAVIFVAGAIPMFPWSW